MKLWSAWLPDLLPFVPGCPNILAEHELRRAAREFFQMTRAWQIFLPTVPVVANATEINLTPADAGLELVRVESASYDGKTMTIKTTAEMDASFHDDWSVHKGTPHVYLQFTPNTIRPYPLPVAAAVTGVRARAAVTPSQTATGISADDLALRFWDEIQIGAKARLMMNTAAPWVNTQMAAQHRLEFMAMIDTAKMHVARSYGNARLPARPRWV